MAEVHVTTENNSGQKVAFLLDDERDAEQIAYFKKLVRREDLRDVVVTKPGQRGARGTAKSGGDN